MRGEDVVYRLARECIVFYSLDAITYSGLLEDSWQAVKEFTKQLSSDDQDKIFEAASPAVLAGAYSSENSTDLMTIIMIDVVWELLLAQDSSATLTLAPPLFSAPLQIN